MIKELMAGIVLIPISLLFFAALSTILAVTFCAGFELLTGIDLITDYIKPYINERIR